MAMPGTVQNRFQFTCPSRSTTPQGARLYSLGIVSIHVPLAEHDCCLRLPSLQSVSFNSRAPRGARRGAAGSSDRPAGFQFTCPSRSTTPPVRMFHVERRFNSRAPRGARPGSGKETAVDARFNSRAPRGARPVFCLIDLNDLCFNSRAPRGARHLIDAALSGGGLFQFTCPSRSTTPLRAQCIDCNRVSIHVPLAEHDTSRTPDMSQWWRFNSRAPRGARR